MKIKNLIALVFFGISFSACENRINPPNIDVEVNIKRFDQNFKKQSLLALKQDYPNFLPVYTNQITQLGNVEDSIFAENKKQFLNNEFIKELYNSVEEIYPDNQNLEKDFIEAYQFFKSYFPNYPLPKNIITIVSGSKFSGALMDDSTLIIGLDMYLGKNSKFYNGFNNYEKNRYQKEFIVPNAIHTLVDDLLQENGIEEPVSGNLLTHCIYHGKRLYITKQILPNLPDSLIIGYESKKMEWCKQNESNIWAFLIEKEMLFNQEAMIISRFINDSPFTAGMSNESPGKLGRWIGWKIIEKFMKNNPNLKLDDLIKEKNVQKILDKSKYKP